MKCYKCRHRLFFVPFPCEVFSCCGAQGETAADIDLGLGISPVIQQVWEHKDCSLFEEGESICNIPKGNPFDVSKVRLEGEEYIVARY